ncbi:tetratricopeptide repeat protein [Blattabacterium cuenoti]|uniref:tetratricopeptide repeat protein n=1 Tax=Blattabacterium cuenoti TaxID=1653831 RepID=UPI001EECA01B|nr:tetratricopeptide repeat protein [Blattabacterium cuenoti]
MYFFTTFFISNKLEIKYLEELNYARKLLNEGFIEKALNKESNNSHLGFLGIISKTPLTKIGNISIFYASICYYNIGNYVKSIEMMNKFKTKDNVLYFIKYGIIGDAYLQMKKKEQSLKNYIIASKINNNKIFTPIFCYKAALLSYSMGKYKDSKRYLKKIEQEYPTFFYKENVEKYLMLIENKFS